MWYYARGEEQIGPVEEGAFRILVDQRIVGPSTLVWREGMPAWVSYHEIAGTVTDWGTPCSECGRPHLVEELLLFEGKRVCASCKDIFFQKLREGTAPSDEMKYASVGRRFLALLIDGVAVYVGFGILMAVMIPVLMAILGPSSSEDGTTETLATALLASLILGFTLFYFTWFVGRFGATPGKMALGIRIVRSDGTAVSYRRAFWRFLAHQLSGAILYIGFIIAFFDDQKRALHDHICDTRVIKKS